MYELYGRLAEWWPLLSDPADYKKESGSQRSNMLRQSCHGGAPQPLLKFQAAAGAIWLLTSNNACRRR